MPYRVTGEHLESPSNTPGRVHNFLKHFYQWPLTDCSGNKREPDSVLDNSYNFVLSIDMSARSLSRMIERGKNRGTLHVHDRILRRTAGTSKSADSSTEDGFAQCAPILNYRIGLREASASET